MLLEGKGIKSFHITEFSALSSSIKERHRFSGDLYKKIVDSNLNPFSITVKDEILYANQAMAELVGLDSAEDLIGRDSRDWIHPEDLEMVSRFSEDRRQGKDPPSEYRYRILSSTGEEKMISVRAEAIEIDGRKVNLGLVQDVSEQVELTDHIRYLNQVLLAIRNVNQLIVTEKDRDVLLQESTELLVETKGYLGAWISIIDDEGVVDRVYQSSYMNIDDLKGENVKTTSFACLKRFGADGIDTYQSVDGTCKDCPGLYSQDIKHSILSMTLSHEDRKYGIFTVAVPENMTGEEEKDLFREVAYDIAFGLYALELDEERARLEKRYRLLLEQTPDAITVRSMDERIFANERALSLFGYEDNEEFLSAPMDEIVTPESLQNVNDRIEARNRGEELSSLYEIEILRKDGESIPVEIHTERIDFFGQTAVMNIIRDISKRKELERQVEDGMNRLRIFLDSMDVGLALWDKDFRYIDANQTILDRFGFKREELLGRTIFDINPNVKESERYDRYLEVLKTGVPYQTDEAIIPTTEGDRLFSVRSYPVADGVGNITRDITEQKEIENKLKAEAAQRNAILNAIPDALSVKDLDYRFVWVNQNLADTMGVSIEDAIGKKCHEIAYNNPNVCDDCPVSEAVESKKRTIAVKQFVDGTIRETVIEPIFDEKGEMVQTLELSRDITEKLGIEENLRESEERYRSIFETAANLITSVDENGIIVDCNQRIEDVLGYTVEEIKGQPMSKIIHPDYMHKANEVLVEILETGFSYDKEYVMVKKNGREIDVKINSSGLKGKDGEYTRTICIIEDVTEINNPVNALKRQAEILSNLQDSVIITDMEGIIQYWNVGAENIFGYRHSEMIGEHIRLLALEENRGIDTDIRLENIRHGRSGQNEYMGVRKDGSEVWILAQTRVLTGAEGDPAGMIGVSKDITELKRAQTESERIREELIEQRIETEKANELSEIKTRFMNMAAHEIRTPITSIQGYSELIQNHLTGTEDKILLSYFDAVIRNADRLDKLSTDLLDMQRIEAGRMVLSKEPVRISSMLELLEIEMGPILGEKDQTLVFNNVLDEVIDVDRTRLMQVLVNLVHNASKFSSPNTNIEVSIRKEDGWYSFSVTDHGVGMLGDDLPKLFTPFPDIHVKGMSHGTGLGLSICKGIVNLHGGEIEAQSKGRDKGSTFSFTIPI